jgi:hypothetical protein
VARGAVVTVDPHVLNELEQDLRAAWPDLVPPLKLYNAPSGVNAGQGNHMVAVDHGGAADGVHVGLKSADRVGEGRQRELSVGEIALLLSLPYATSFKMMSPINGLAGLSGKPFVATRWADGAESIEPPSAPGAAAQQHPVDFVRCIAQWIGLGLMLGIGDRHNGNWVCSPDGKQVVMIDNEDSFSGTASAGDYRMPLQYVGALDPIRQEAAVGTGIHHDALVAGLVEFHRKWTAKRAEIDQVLQRHAWSATYVSPWMTMSEDDFVRQVVSQL